MKNYRNFWGILSLVLFLACQCPISAFAEKEWTVAIFFNGDNDLDDCVNGDKLELAKVGSKSWLNIVTLTDHFNAPANIDVIGEKGELQSMGDWGEIDMGDYRQLVQFMKYVVKNFPARKYCLVIWNHGSGWKDGRKGLYKGISFDQTSGNEISTADLCTAMKEIKAVIGHNLDILWMDACFMQMVEVAFVCMNSCDYIVASEEEAPGLGVPYDVALSNLEENSSKEEFVKSLVTTYIDSYSGGSQGTKVATQSAIKCSTFPKLLDGIEGFAKACMASGYNEHFSGALKKVQRFLGQQNIDLLHFVKLIKDSDSDSSMQNACEKFLAAYDATVIATGRTWDSVSNALGLAIYFPWDFHFDAAYDKIPFCQASLWCDMIHDYYKMDAARTIVHSLEESDLMPLEKYSREIQAGKALNEYVIPMVNFRLYCEGGSGLKEKSRVQDLIRRIK